MYLIDTCAISELYRKQPNRGVSQFFEQTSQTVLFISVVTIGELTKGFFMLDRPAARAELEEWLRAMRTRFHGNLLEIDEETAEIWGRIAAIAQMGGRALSADDGLIAATALRRQLELVTRNERDFAGTGAAILNPWREE